MKFHARKHVAKLIKAGKVDPDGTWCVEMPNPANPEKGAPYRLYQLRRSTDNQLALFVDDGLTRVNGKPLNGRQHLISQVSKMAEERDDGTEIPLYFSDEPLPVEQAKLDRGVKVRAANAQIVDFLERKLREKAASYEQAQAQFKRMKKAVAAAADADANAADRAKALTGAGADREKGAKREAKLQELKEKTSGEPKTRQKKGA